VGVWKTIDDDGRTEKSLVRIADAGGQLVGRIETLFDAAKKDAVCDKCTDERKGQRVIGLTILRDVTRADGEQPLWGNGSILDPNNGKVYRVRLKPVEGGAKLEVRGYVGPFYRNQHWIRVE